MFASSKVKFTEFLRDAIGRDDSDDDAILTCTYVLRPDLTQELNMPIKNRLSKEALAFMIEDIGDEILDCFSTEEISSRLSPEQRLTGLSPKERLTGLSPEELISALTPEQRRQLQRLLEQ